MNGNSTHPDQLCDQWNQDEVDTAKEVVQTPSDSILNECPQFRVLVIGGTGVGKSTICKEIFGLDEIRARVSHQQRGIHDIREGLTFPGQNERIIIHDSKGFEGGESDTFDEVVGFIRERRQETTLRKQLHCIWYCISCEKEDRPIQFSEEKFFKNLSRIVGQIPVIVVFTKYDKLVKTVYAEYMSENLERILEGEVSQGEKKHAVRDSARQKFEKTWKKQYSAVINDIRVPSVEIAIPPSDLKGDFKNVLENSDWTVQRLVDMTVRNLTNHDLKTLWATAQNQWAGLKCDATIETAMASFPSSMAWDSVPLIPGVSGIVFWRNFSVLFSRISPPWNILDPSHLLFDPYFQRQFIESIYDTNAWGKIARNALDIFGFLNAPANAATLAKAVAGIVLLHEELFYLQKSQVANGERVHPLTETELKRTLQNFRHSQSRKSMADTIWGATLLFKAYSKDRVAKLIREAVQVARAQNIRNL